MARRLLTTGWQVTVFHEWTVDELVHHRAGDWQAYNVRRSVSYAEGGHRVVGSFRVSGYAIKKDGTVGLRPVSMSFLHPDDYPAWLTQLDADYPVPDTAKEMLATAEADH